MKKSEANSSGFRSLLATQFLGALNDNTFKIIVSLILGSSGIAYLCLTQIFFALPYLIFSAFAGYLADRFSKTRCIRVYKFFELLIMLLGASLLWFGMGDFLLVVVFLMAWQSALFSPCKYGIMPEILPSKDLSSGNGYLELFTFLAIILGTAFGVGLKVIAGDNLLIPGIAFVFIAAIGLAASFRIPVLDTPKSSRAFRLNPIAEAIDSIRLIKQDRNLMLVFVSIAFFWFMGSYVQICSYLYMSQLVAVDFDTYYGIFLGALAVGIGLGCMIAGKVSEGKVELGLVPIGMAGVGLSCVLLGFVNESFYLSVALAALTGISGGLFIVPLDAYLQENSPETMRGRYIAASNFVCYSAIVLSSSFLWIAVEKLHLSANTLFFLIGGCSLAMTVIAVKVMPEMLVRCINWILTHTIYRVSVFGAEHVPEKGGALIVCNHVSYVDASIILASVKRPVRFIMYKPIYQNPWVKFFAKSVKAIPIDAGRDPKQIVEALKEARDRVEQGELVCIFAEGALTRVGNMLTFNKGLERIVKGLSEPIIPACLDQLWGSIFSYSGKKVIKKIPKQIPYRMSLSFGAPLPSVTKAYRVREKVQELAAESTLRRQSSGALLHHRFIDRVRRKPFGACMEDSTGKKVNSLQALVAGGLLAEEVDVISDEQMVGILLPPSVAGALANLGVLLAGKTPVNLNYTASSDALKSAYSQCGLKKIISSKAFVEKVGDLGLEGMVYIDDMLGDFTPKEKLFASLKYLLLPACLIKKMFKAPSESSADQALATIIFSSGSTGVPKGVMLTHSNIGANLESLYGVFDVGSSDCVLGALPLFHAFGFTGTLWLPLLGDFKVFYHPNPVDAAKIGEFCESKKISLLMTTPTFLAGYLRRFKKEQLASLRYVIVGAEKLSSRLAESFEKRFGVLPLEGYGATELSPVALINIPDFSEGGVKQVGGKLGSAGHPLPGVAVKIVGIEDGQELAPGKEGLLLVKGANVMKGYLGEPEKSAEVLVDGWYRTGDVAKIDTDGFVTITDRLSRFSKIGGEMVPHIQIEEAVDTAVGGGEFKSAVVALPDEKRGEKLVVLCNQKIQVQEVVKKLAEAGLPNLWIPKRDCFFIVDEIPMLGTGKMDLGSIKKLAAELAGPKEASSKEPA